LPIVTQATYKNTPTKTPQPTHPPKKLLQFYQQQNRMPKGPKDIKKLLQLDHQQQKDPKSSKINMKLML
jgi:hypothetical protein